jgi:tetratricopeptide (TPR) repeat protein
LRRDFTLSILPIKLLKFALFALIITLISCAFQKKSGFNRAMQDLTAHYNILFNANELLQQKQDSYALAFIDSYGDMLNVYQDTTLQSGKSDKDLDAAIAKANVVINEKDQSHYIGDAYLVVGKANFLGGNYFNATELFNIVIKTFPKELSLVQEAAAWKARSLLYLKKYPEAKLTLDTAMLNVKPKKHLPAELYAAKLQYDIDVQDYTDGEAMAKKAIQYGNTKVLRLRWTYILGQLQELNHENAAAVASYISITKSNASFEMAFNAELNRIRIDDERNGIKLSRVDRLLTLLKNENNLDFKDQIYYQIAQIYLLDKETDKAIKYYKLSIRTSRTNQNQKGLSYLRIADIDFNIKADYVSAKKYYDSTLTNLSLNYPGYQTIQKKNNNLKLLVDRLHIIGHEDTLQILAKMDEKTRGLKIDTIVANQILQRQADDATTLANAQANASNNIQSSGVSRPNGGNFYFYNSNAVSQGFAAFKRKWGNRKLEDDWRRSNRSTTNVTGNGAVVANNADPDALPADKQRSKNSVAAGSYRQQLIRELPLTPQLLNESNTRIYGAYLDIANFYRDILDDKKEAAKTYQVILDKFPNDPNKAFVYYNLYRLYSETDAAKSDDFKNKLLKNYPETPFAKVITDPNYGKTLDDKDAAFNTEYNKVYDLYAQKKYPQAIKKIDTLVKQYPAHKQVVQLTYLRVISAGHGEKLPPFQDDLQQIVDTYPTDGLITPLVKQHLAYINANKQELSGQTYAIMNNDTTELTFIPPIVYQKQTAYRRTINPEPESVKTVETKLQPKTDPKQVGKTTNEVIVITLPPKAVKEVPLTFSQRDSTNYYFVVSVSTGTIDLSSSRFGIGQFNRANYPPNTIKHQLKNAGPDNQLIYVGRFYSLAEVKKYAREIIPLMPEIMKVSKDKYSFFVITQENLDKLADKKQLDSYLDYYQKTY